MNINKEILDALNDIKKLLTPKPKIKLSSPGHTYSEEKVVYSPKKVNQEKILKDEGEKENIYKKIQMEKANVVFLEEGITPDGKKAIRFNSERLQDNPEPIYGDRIKAMEEREQFNNLVKKGVLTKDGKLSKKTNDLVAGYVALQKAKLKEKAEKEKIKNQKPPLKEGETPQKGSNGGQNE